MITLHPAKIETPVVLAQHRGRCRKGCRQPIRAEEPIQRVDGYWYHEECIPPGAIEDYGDHEVAA